MTDRESHELDAPDGGRQTSAGREADYLSPDCLSEPENAPQRMDWCEKCQKYYSGEGCPEHP